MLQRLEQYIINNNLFSKKDKLLVGFSGGIDSLVLTHLLRLGDYRIELAHCNFNLRGKDSEADEKFCKEFAKINNIRIHTIKFETKIYAEENKLSIQMAARELRYKWFKKLVNENKLKYIITAHHANDVVETLFINLTRGTGLTGLQGIPLKQAQIRRPLLFVSKIEIENYAKTHKLKFRKDKSNDEVKYARNLIRLKVIPELKKINPSLENTILDNIKLFKESNEIVNSYVQLNEKLLVKKNATGIKIDLTKLLNTITPNLLLHEFINRYGFHSLQIDQIIASSKSNQPGKIFYSKNYQLLIDRKLLIVSEVSKENYKFKELVFNTYDDLKKAKAFKKIEVVKSTNIIFDKSVGQFDLASLEFPLQIRNWKEGDKFKPLGMNGFKKVSDFLINQKILLTEKKHIKLLCDKENRIIWVIGYRIDERFKINEHTKEVLKLSLT